MPLERTGWWSRRWAGDSVRKSRIHDALGGRVPLAYLLANMPRAVATGVVRLLTGHLPARPWISYAAQAEIARFCATRDTRMIEFGSGSSTQWFASQVTHLVSVESDPDWHADLSAKLSNCANVDYRLAPTMREYATPAVDGLFDVVMVDGAWRAECVEFALTRLAPGALVYLDNSDKGAGGASGDVPRARTMLIAFAEANRLRWREFTDFAPAQLFAQRGLMVGGLL